MKITESITFTIDLVSNSTYIVWSRKLKRAAVISQSCNLI